MYSKFGDFYQFYLSEHSNKINRILHFLGTSMGLIILSCAWYFKRPILCLVALATGYLCAWIGHFFFEKNRPATFKYPVYSFFGDFRFFFELLIGRQKFGPAEVSHKQNTLPKAS